MDHSIFTLDTAPASTAAGRVEDAIACIAEVDADVIDGMGGDELLSFTETLERLGRRIDALRVASATTVAGLSDPVHGADGLAQSRGYRTGADLLEQVTGASGSTVRRRIRVGALVQPRRSDTGYALPALFPTIGGAFAAGALGVDTAEAIGRELSAAAPRAAVDDLLAAERCLVGQATGSDSTDPGTNVPVPADLIRGQARLWRDRLDVDGVEPRAERAKANRDFWVSRTARDGLHAVGGGITSDVAAAFLAIFETVLSPLTKPMFLPNDAAPGVDAAGVPDTRTAGQKRADVVAAMARSFLGATEFSVPPAVLVTLDGDSYATGRGTGTISGIDGPVPASVITQIACDGGTQPIWFTPDGRVQALGTAGRFFTAGQRRAIAARDGDTCLDPNCAIPVTAAEAHHVIPHSQGGATHVDNGVLLCWYHHGLVDTGILIITMMNGKPLITSPRWHPRT